MWTINLHDLIEAAGIEDRCSFSVCVKNDLCIDKRLYLALYGSILTCNGLDLPDDNQVRGRKEYILVSSQQRHTEREREPPKSSSWTFYHEQLEI